MLLERLTIPADRERIKHDFANGIPGSGEPGRGRRLGQGPRRQRRVQSPSTSASRSSRSPTSAATDPVDALCDVLMLERGRPTIVVTMMDEPDVQQILAHPLVMIGSDAIITRGKPHPRTWGTYPRVLGHYAREVGLFSQAEAVRKMTSLPAQKFGLWDRGLVRPGLAADLIVFDAAAVLDLATHEEPEQAPAGLPHVIVNGTFAVRDGQYTGAGAEGAPRP